jgi:pilus assembly protein CpaB
MRPSRIVLLLVAILAGGLAAFLATRGDAPVQQVVTETQVIEEKKERILVAVGPIGVGERLSPKTVQWQDWPEGSVRPEYITMTASPDALDQLSGAVARFEIFPGDPILEIKLVRASQGYLSAVLEKGKRGVSIAVTADSASGGFIVPNDRVDVVLTRPGDTGQISETILHNVKVLAIGARLGEAGATGGPENPDNPRAEVFSNTAIATLELDPIQGETVINAARIGSLSLALRSMADFTEDDSTAVRRPSNQAVRMIKFGKEMSVMAGSAVGEGAPTAVNPAAYAPETQPSFTPAPPMTPPIPQSVTGPFDPAQVGQ